MRGVPPWIVLVMGLLAAVLIVVGWHDRHEAGYIPFALGIFFALFTLISLGGLLSNFASGSSGKA